MKIFFVVFAIDVMFYFYNDKKLTLSPGFFSLSPPVNDSIQYKWNYFLESKLKWMMDFCNFVCSFLGLCGQNAGRLFQISTGQRICRKFLQQTCSFPQYFQSVSLLFKPFHTPVVWSATSSSNWDEFTRYSDRKWKQLALVGLMWTIRAKRLKSSPRSIWPAILESYVFISFDVVHLKDR